MYFLRSRFFYKKTDKILKNRIFQKKDKTIFCIAYLLLLIGIVMVISASYSATKIYSVSSYHFAIKHIVFIVFTVFFIHFFPSKNCNLEKFSSILWYCSIFGLVGVFFGSSIKGANRWINVFGLSIQPAEFMKIAVVLQGAKYIEKNWYKFCIIYLTPIILLLMQPDLGSSILLSALAIAQISTKYFNWKIVLMTILTGIVLIICAYYLFPHVRSRIDIFFNLNADLYGAGYQLNKSLKAMINGGFFGRGFGKGTVKNFLPDAHTDFVFSALIEEFGILGGCFVIIIFMYLGYHILQVRADNEYLSLVQYSFIILILAQAWLNIASTLAMIPAKGLTLPLISYGGSSLTAQGIIFGILSSVSKLNKKFMFPV